MSTARDPIRRFATALERVERSEKKNPTAVTLATADPSGRPSARVVLLKGVDERGFVFFTNYGSRKARELQDNPQAALCFYWRDFDEQVRVEGRVELLPEEESDAYFASRERASQIGAWASRQSEPMASRTQLLARYAAIEARFAGRPVPRPPFWGGFLLVPQRIEFWFNQIHRLHDRIVYTRQGDGWQSERLFP